MLSAISSSTSGTAAAAPAPRAPLTLDAQLARYQTQLSDCVNCDSAKTPQGQQQIADISSKINAIKQQMAQAPVASTAPKPSAPEAAGYTSQGLQAAPAGSIVDTYA